MWSTRARLAAAYAGLSVAALVAFSAAVYFARRQSAYEQLALRGVRAAEQVLAAMRASELAGRPLTMRDTATSGFSLDTVVVRPLAQMRVTLEPRPGIFLVLAANDRLLYSSFAMRQLSLADQAEINRVALLVEPGGSAALVRLPADSVLGGRVMLVARSDPSLAPNISRVVVAVPTSDAEVAPRLLIGTAVLLAPLVIILGAAVAYAIAGSAFKPVDQLINEVEAISDGRSLHRRVPTEAADVELARLADTLNRMIGRLQSSFGALRRFTADASHELKTPLTVVRADIERAMHPALAQDERLQALEEAMQEVARMSDLVNSLLTLARADEGRFDLHREPMRLEPVVRDVFETGVILGEEAGVTVSLPLVEDAWVLGDELRLRQLFLNLVTNAVKYTPRGGHVEMTLSLRNNNEVGFAVRDTGVGIAAADLPHVFERFWRADRVRSRSAGEGKGSFGLGLAISQWIAQAHGGSLTAQSRLGRGSIFTVLLPVATAPAEQGSSAAQGSSPDEPERPAATAQVPSASSRPSAE